MALRKCLRSSPQLKKELHLIESTTSTSIKTLKMIQKTQPKLSKKSKISVKYQMFQWACGGRIPRVLKRRGK